MLERKRHVLNRLFDTLFGNAQNFVSGPAIFMRREGFNWYSTWSLGSCRGAPVPMLSGAGPIHVRHVWPSKNQGCGA